MSFLSSFFPPFLAANASFCSASLSRDLSLTGAIPSFLALASSAFAAGLEADEDDDSRGRGFLASSALNPGGGPEGGPPLVVSVVTVRIGTRRARAKAGFWRCTFRALRARWRRELVRRADLEGARPVILRFSVHVQVVVSTEGFDWDVPLPAKGLKTTALRATLADALIVLTLEAEIIDLGLMTRCKLITWAAWRSRCS